MTERVLVVAHSAVLGGAELGLLRYVASGPPYDIEVLVLEDGPLVARLRQLGVPVLLPDGPGTFAALRAVLREVRRPHLVVLSWTLRAAMLVGLVQPRRGHLLYLQDLLVGGYFGRVRTLVALLFIVRRAGGIMVNSEATRRSLPEGVRRRARWVVYTPSGVGPPRAGSSGTGPAHSLDVLRPLYLGRIAQWKGPELFIEACELVGRRDEDAIQQATMAGGSFFHEEDYRSTVLGLAAAAHTPIEVLDHQDDLDALFARANVLVHTSTSPEPFGQVIVQAMARGLLVVAPNAGGPAEMIADVEHGFLYEMGDAASLADRLLAVRQNPRNAEEVARRGSMAVTRFADDTVVTLINSALAEFAGVGLQPA